MNIQTIIFENGIQLQNISPDLSNRIGLLLFADKKQDTNQTEQLRELVTKRSYKKRKGFVHQRYTPRDVGTIVYEYHLSPRNAARRIAKKLGRSEKAIEQKIHTLGLFKKRHEEQIPAPSVFKSVDEIPKFNSISEYLDNEKTT